MSQELTTSRRKDFHINISNESRPIFISITTTSLPSQVNSMLKARTYDRSCFRTNEVSGQKRWR